MMKLCTRVRRDGEEIEVLDLSLVDHDHWDHLEERDPSVMHLEGWIIREERTQLGSRCEQVPRDPVPQRNLRRQDQAPPALVLDISPH